MLSLFTGIMQRLIYTTLLLSAFIYTKALVVYDDENFAYADDGLNDIVRTRENNANVQSFRNGRILWPYPLNNKSDPINDNGKPGSLENKQHLSKLKVQNRKARFGHWSYPQSPIVDMMMQTFAVNYSPANGNDPFDFLRDSYPLPKGML